MATIRQLNNYPEIKTNVGINRVIQYKLNGNIHPAIQNVQRYIDKYGPNSNFVVINNILAYNINQNRVLRVARPNERNAFMQEIFDDEERGLGVGLSQFFNQVISSYLNIRKIDTDEFLKKQGNYQLTRIPTSRINKPLKALGLNHIWAIDLIDLHTYDIPTVNGNRKYLFSCVDLYSGKYWARAISNRDNNNTVHTLTDALNSIIIEAQTTPRMIKVDNEFSKGHIADWMQQQGIRIIKSRTHVPTDNAVVERVNKEIRKKIRSGFVRHNNWVWVAHLQTYVNNINNQRKIGETETPNEQWQPGYNRNNNNPALANVMPNNATPETVYRVNDYVRVKMHTVNTKMRAREKNGMETAKSAVLYSPEIYRVVHVNRNGNTRTYILVKPHIDNIQEEQDGDDIIVTNIETLAHKKFYASDLIKVGTRRLENIVHSSIVPLTNDRGLLLNQIRPPLTNDII